MTTQPHKSISEARAAELAALCKVVVVEPEQGSLFAMGMKDGTVNAL